MKKDIKKDISPNQKSWMRLKRNKPAIFGMIWIGLAVLIAFLGYGITPDATPNANDQVNEVSLKRPGFNVKMLKVRKNRIFENPSFVSRMFFGAPNPYKLIPINNYSIQGDTLQAEIYQGENSQTGEPLPGTSAQFHLADIVFPLSIQDAQLTANGSNINFKNIEEKTETVELNQLQSLAEKNIFSKTYYLGTDKFGRDSLSRLIIGVRISLMVGLLAVFISLTIGVFMGAIAGYFGGRVDNLVMLIVNTVWSIPTLLLVFAIVIALGRGFWQIFLAVGLTMWVDVARIVRGQILSIKKIQFVEAAESMGFSKFRIIVRHILPNVLGPVMVIAATNFATAILIEAGLSYLGFGIQPPQPSWGTMIKENYGFLFSDNPFPALEPALAIMLMVLAFNLVGNGLRDALDVQTNLDD